MKTLILGTSYISIGDTGAQNYPLKMVKLWFDLAAKLNPGTPVLLIDSASPEPAFGALEGRLGSRVIHLDEQGSPRGYCKDIDGLNIGLMPNNIGHINLNGRDGWGRSFCAGINLAIQFGFDYIAYADSDIICTQPVAPTIEKMARSGVKVACPFDTTYGFLENGLMYLDVAYLRDSNFVSRYDWKSRTRTTDPNQIPEVVFERLLEDVLFTLPMRGLRNDFDRLTVNNFDHMWPYGGPDYLTHARDYDLYLRMLDRAGIKLNG